MRFTTSMPLLTVLLMITAAVHAQSHPQPMSDAELDGITAGSAAPAEELATFEAMRTTRRGSDIHAFGSAELLSGQDYRLLSLADNAQQNLSALININAVNSPVNVLLNLNVNVNSNVGEMQQINIQGTPGGIQVTPVTGK